MLLYRFDDFQLDPRSRRLTRNGGDVAAEPRVLELVIYLLEHRERAVGRDELIAAVWGRLDSSDSTLAQAVLKARRLFGDDGSTQRTIRTVARFGYQWIGPIDAPQAAVARADESTRDAFDGPPHVMAPARASEATSRVDGAHSRTRNSGVVASNETTGADPKPIAKFTRATASVRNKFLSKPQRSAAVGAVIVLVALIAIAGAYQARYRERSTASEAALPAVVPNLILVAPASVHSAVAEDSWMRLGIMAMAADALRALPNRVVVANEMALAAAGDHESDPGSLRAKSGAATIVTIDARRQNERWLMEATVHRADGPSELVDATADDAVVAAGALAERIRATFAPDERGATPSPERVALAARMQAAILDGHAERALALAEASPMALSADPDIVLLRARALNRVGRAGDATAALDALIAHAGDPAPPWLAPAWSTLGYSALIEGSPEVAEQDFRHALAVSGNDRNEIGRAWRGLGNAQAARGAFDEAETSYLRARLELSAGGDRLLLAHLLDDLGTVAGRRGRFDEAVDRYREAASAAAALGATEIELGARMNVALTEEERLHHRTALAAWRELLPRIGALSYPSMHRYATVHYADALAESGALSEAAGALAQALPSAEARDALEDVAADRLRVRLEIGDARAAADEARSIDRAAVTETARAADAWRLQAALAVGDDAAAQDIAERLAAGAASSDSAASEALALWWRHRGEDAKADAAARAALDAARARGSPRDLRDAAVALATTQLSRGDVDAARTLAALVEPYADDDFAITLLLARVDAAAGDVASARRQYDAAHALAGERWTTALAAEASGRSVVIGPRVTTATPR